MTPLFAQEPLLERYTTKQDVTAYRWQDLALRALQDLGDDMRYKPRYMRVFKVANAQHLGLDELVAYCKEHARGPAGAYFLNEAEILTGLKKRKVG